MTGSSAKRSFPYILPFGVFAALLVLSPALRLPTLLDQSMRVAIMLPLLWFVARPAIDLHIQSWLGSLGIGLLIFAIWIAPDTFFPQYRHHWLFENRITGIVVATLSETSRRQPLVLAMRTLRAVLIVPIVEELFWRGWLMRWLIAPDFSKIRLGTYTAASFWLVAFLFAVEHGPYWDVGLLAGILFNAWMIRIKSLGDLILTHAVANGALSAYVIAAGKWEYWQ